MNRAAMSRAERAAFDDLQRELIDALCTDIRRPVRTPAPNDDSRYMVAHEAAMYWAPDNTVERLWEVVSAAANLPHDATPSQLMALNVQAKALIAEVSEKHASWYAMDLAEAQGVTQ